MIPPASSSVTGERIHRSLRQPYRAALAICVCLVVASLARAESLTVAAASDLAPLEAALRQGFGADVRFSFGASGALLRQIENGAPYDVYLSANEQYVAEGVRKGVLQGPAVLYANGRIALWSRHGGIRTLEQLTGAGVLHVAIANPAYAPYGAAAKKALESSGLWAAVSPKIVYGENIRQTLQFAESGNADAAIVAWSLVHNRGGALLPSSLHEPIRQAGAVVTSSKQRAAAGKFLQFLSGSHGVEILRSHGLEPARAVLRQ